MAELVNMVKIVSEKLGLCINASKTKIKMVDRIKWLLVSAVLRAYEKVIHDSSQWKLIRRSAMRTRMVKTDHERKIEVFD